MATDIAANSDSTLTNSHGARLPASTRLPRASTMWVCGEMGYAQMTCGRHSAIASATAADPSTCLSTAGLLAAHGLLHEFKRLGGSRDVCGSDFGRKLFLDGCRNGGQRDTAGKRGKPSEERCIRQRTADVAQRDLGRGHR